MLIKNKNIKKRHYKKNNTRKYHKNTPQKDTTKRRIRNCQRKRHRDKDIYEIVAVE